MLLVFFSSYAVTPKVFDELMKPIRAVPPTFKHALKKINKLVGKPGHKMQCSRIIGDISAEERNLFREKRGTGAYFTPRCDPKLKSLIRKAQKYKLPNDRFPFAGG